MEPDLDLEDRDDCDDEGDDDDDDEGEDDDDDDLMMRRTWVSVSFNSAVNSALSAIDKYCFS